MTYDFHNEFFLVRDEWKGTVTLFHRWWSVVDFLTDDVMTVGRPVIFDEDENEWRAPKDREECFNLLFNLKDIGDLNDLFVDIWYIDLVRFSD